MKNLSNIAYTFMNYYFSLTKPVRNTLVITCTLQKWQRHVSSKYLKNFSPGISLTARSGEESSSWWWESSQETTMHLKKSLQPQNKWRLRWIQQRGGTGIQERESFFMNLITVQLFSNKLNILTEPSHIVPSKISDYKTTYGHNNIFF